MINIILKITEKNKILSVQILNQNYPKADFRSSLGFWVDNCGCPLLASHTFFLRGYNKTYDNHTASKTFINKNNLTTYKNKLIKSLKEWSAWMDKGNIKTFDPTIINFSNMKNPNKKDIYLF